MNGPASPGPVADPALPSTESVIIKAWNTVLFDKFCRFRHLVVHGLSRHSEVAFERCAYPAGARLLDIGCGFGDTTVALAERVGPSGEAVGVDCAECFIEASRATAAQAGARNVRFEVRDVQQDTLGGPYDYAFARFGTMFFELPGAAMRNIRRALTPGGRLTQIVWRRREDNPWVHEAERCVTAIVPVVSHENTDAVHCGPGPFSMAGPDMVSALLVAAGFERICFERHDCDICIGRDLDEAVEFAMALGPAGEILRLAGDEAERLRPRVIAALRETLARFERPDGVRAPSSAWFITATNPA